MEYAGIYNVNEYYTNHYFSTIFEENAKETIQAWRKEADANDTKTPWAAMRDAGILYSRIHERVSRHIDSEDDLDNLCDLANRWLESLGYPAAEPQQITLDEKESDTTISVYHEIKKSNGSPLLWVLLAQPDPDNEDQTLLAGQLVNSSGKTFNDNCETMISKIFFEMDEPPRWILLIGPDEIDLIDRNKWNEKRYLRFDMEELYARREEPAFQQTAVLLHKDSICPKDGSSSLDRFDEESHKHAAGVSKELKKPLREAVELLGNEVLYYYQSIGQDPYKGETKIDAGELTLECLRYMYRMLFVLFIEARPELGYAPMLNQVYASGYSLENLRDIVADANAETEAIGDGYFLHESITKLFNLIYSGYPTDDATLKELSAAKSISDVYALEPLKAHIFDPEFTPLLEKAKLRNQIWLKIIELMSITPSTGRRGERRGRISYAALGINQMGAVYEALLSYRGFIAEDDLYEVKRKGDKFDELEVGYFVPERDLDQYDEDERVRYESGEKKGKLRMYPKGTFIYRLAGREREKSASYYTPESLTKCLVKYALKELLEGKSADEILELKICEPAMGSAAFLNEAINQLAEAYLDRKQREPDMKPISGADRMQELQRVKMYIADRNVYGVDLNPVAVELAEVSLWLNTIYKGGYVPWFGTQLVNGNSLIGARRQVYDVSQLTTNRNGLRWYENAPERVMPGTKRIKEKQVYHFLLGDPGMANYDDKVIKNLAPDQIKTLKQWNKEFNKPWTSDDITVLRHLSDKIDTLWQMQLEQRRELNRQTSDPLSVYGHEENMDAPRTTIREKDVIYHKLYKTEEQENAGPYARLKFAMDFWCALWFWPIEKADLIPDRSTFLMYMSLILEGGLGGFLANASGQLSLFSGERADLNTTLMQTFGNSELPPVDLDKICDLNETLHIARDIAQQNHFMHWELEFTDVFEDHGGFDFIVGNPPWIKLEWNEQALLSDRYPIFAVKNMSATQTVHQRDQVLKNKELHCLFLNEYEIQSGQQAFFNAIQNYCELKGQQTNLFKCFLPQAWTFVHKDGISAFIHPDGVYDDPKGDELRCILYPKLRRHFQFVNEKLLFPEVGHPTVFSVNIYGTSRSLKNDKFHSISNLFDPNAIDQCYEKAEGEAEGIKDENGEWSIKGHPDRVLYYGERELSILASLSDDNANPYSAKLLSLQTRQLLETIQCFASYPSVLRNTEIFVSEMWHETYAQNDGTIKRNTNFPKNIIEMIYSGPHISVANPVFKTPRSICEEKGDYDVIDLTKISDDYIARTNYSISVPISEYSNRDSIVFDKKYHTFPKLVSRKMLNLKQERTFNVAIIPEMSGHINGLVGIVFSNFRDLIICSASWASIPIDFYVKVMGKANFNYAAASGFPVLNSIYDSAIITRGILLNALTVYYKEIYEKSLPFMEPNISWSKKDVRLSIKNLPEKWNHNIALRTDFERRQALVEIDVLTAMAIGMNLEQLKTIYRLQFAVARQYETDTWYDKNGRIVFTTNRSLINIGFPRLEWEKIKDAKSETFTRTIIDDTMPGGPVERVIEYVAPFDRCDREQDYETAWKFFEEKYGKQQPAASSQKPIRIQDPEASDQDSETRSTMNSKSEKSVKKPAYNIDKPVNKQKRVSEKTEPQKPIFGQPLKKPKQEPLIPKPTKEEQAGQSTFLEYAYYRCPLCGKLVMSFDRSSHESTAHPGKKVKWKKMGG